MPPKQQIVQYDRSWLKWGSHIHNKKPSPNLRKLGDGVNGELVGHEEAVATLNAPNGHLLVLTEEVGQVLFNVTAALSLVVFGVDI